MFDDLGVNNYNVTVTYLGDDNYNASVANASFNVTKRDISINITAPAINVVGHPVVFTVHTNETISELIYITVGDKNYTSFVKDGVGNFTVYGLDVGNYTAVVEFLGNSIYNYANNSAKFNVTGKNVTSLAVTVSNITVGDKEVITVVVDGADTGEVIVTIAGDPYTLTVVNGTANLTLSNLTARAYHVTARYIENDLFLPSNTTANFVVNKKNSTINIDVSNIHVGDVEVINVTVPEGASGYVLINVAGIHVYAEITGTTFNVSIPDLALGNYTVVATYLGDDNYEGNFTTDSFNVTKKGLNITIESSNIVVGHPELSEMVKAISLFMIWKSATTLQLFTLQEMPCMLLTATSLNSMSQVKTSLR